MNLEKSINIPYVLMLVYVNDKNKDIANNEYPEKGYIKAKKFIRNIDISNGLSGCLWGNLRKCFYENINGKWIIVRTENNNLIKIDYDGRYKFKEGVVLYEGTVFACVKFILKYILDKKLNKKYTFNLKNLIGTKEWKLNNNKKIEHIIL